MMKKTTEFKLFHANVHESHLNFKKTKKTN